jgi:hypothetical protein
MMTDSQQSHLTKTQILEALKKEGITDLNSLAEHTEKIAKAKNAGAHSISPVATAGWVLICSRGVAEER